MEGTSAYQLNQDALLERCHALLGEWGEYQRTEPGLGVGGGDRSILAVAMDQWGEDRHSRRKRLKRNPAYSRTTRKIQVGEKLVGGKLVPSMVPVLHLVPPEPAKQTRVRGTVTGEPWPAHVVAVERILAQAPKSLLSAARVYYIAGYSIRSSADTLRISKHQMQGRLDAVRWWVASRVPDDPELNGG